MTQTNTVSLYGEVTGRLEGASGGSVDLDAHVYCALNPGWRPGIGIQVGAVISHGAMRGVKPYTSSLDAALALVEEKLPGWRWSIGGPYPSGLYRAGFFGSAEADWQAIHAPVYARTAPIAVLIALLRSLEGE
jgi:hypothetical protein